MLKKVNDFITKYPQVAIGILISLFVAIWYFFVRKKDDGHVKAGNDKSNLTHDPVFYLTIANDLHKAMDGFGTDEKKIRTVLSGLNKDELIEVYNVYGLRESDVHVAWNQDSKMNLIQALQNELSGDDLNYVADIFRGTGLWV